MVGREARVEVADDGAAERHALDRELRVRADQELVDHDVGLLVLPTGLVARDALHEHELDGLALSS